MRPLKVLCACEESQAVTLAFRELGHEAYSCDLQDCSGSYPCYHIKGDVLDVLYDDWDMLIAFPPCTYLSNAGANRLFHDGAYDLDRCAKAKEAKLFFLELLNSEHIPFRAVENPTPGGFHKLPPYSQVIEPYMFGDPWKKRTCLWLRNLPILMATDIVVPDGLWVHTSSKDWGVLGHRTGYMRSKTFPGVARAMAAQWSAHVCDKLKERR